MKKCPSCDKTYDDAMRFCQTDGTPLVEDEPAFDPFATIMAKPGEFKAPASAEPAQPHEPAAEPAAPEEPAAEPAKPESVTLEPVVETAAEPAPEPIAEPDDVLDLPTPPDPLKTMYVSESEMQAVFGAGTDDTKPAEAPQPEPPSFSVPDIPSPSFTAPESPLPDLGSTPPSPFSEPSVPSPRFEDAPTVMQPPVKPTFEEPAPAADRYPTPTPPAEEWTPPPAPVREWEKKEIGSNTPFQPPPAAAGESKGLALGSLICGILSFTICGSMGILLGPVAIVLGFIGKKRADERPAEYGGRGLALAGMITGVLGLLVGILALAYVVLVFGSALW